MKKALTIIFLSLSAVLILDTFNAGHAFVMFFLAGIIPGTNIAIDASRMFEGFTLLIGFTLSRITMTLLHKYGIGQKLRSKAQASKGTILSAQS